MMESSMSSMHASHYDDARIQEYLEKKIAKNKINFEQQVKNMKPIVMQEAAKFIKEQAHAITKMLTRAHYNLNREF